MGKQIRVIDSAVFSAARVPGVLVASVVTPQEQLQRSLRNLCARAGLPGDRSPRLSLRLDYWCASDQEAAASWVRSPGFSLAAGPGVAAQAVAVARASSVVL